MVLFALFSRGGVEDTRLEAKAKDTKKNPRTALPGTDPLEAKDRNARGQDTSASALQKKKGLHKNFSGDLQNKTSFQKFFQAPHKILTDQK